ncbi:MAG TPA: EamA family transporter [Gammaproteobacteria bacterium]|nr:EamA family transporter [Gammaproteobacteria bacterium]
MNQRMPQSHHMDGPAVSALGVLMLIWGYNWVAQKIALQYAAPFDFAALRTFFAALLLLLPVLLFRPGALRLRRIRATLLLGFLQTTCFLALVNLALVHGGAGKSSVLVYTMPFWVALLAPLVLREHFRRSQLPALLLAFTGLLLIIAPWQQQPDLVSSVLALGAGFMWALSVLVAKTIPIRDTWELVALTGWQMLFGSLILIVIALLVPSPPIHWSGPFIAALLYNIGPANALAWFLWLFIVNRLPASVSGLNALAIPIVGVLAGWLQLGERPGLVEAAGMLLVFIALTLLAFSMRRPTARKDTPATSI